MWFSGICGVCFYQPDNIPVAQSAASKHCRDTDKNIPIGNTLTQAHAHRFSEISFVRGRQRCIHLSCCCCTVVHPNPNPSCELWPMTLNLTHIGSRWITQQHAKSLGQGSFHSKIIVQTHTHTSSQTDILTQQTDHSTWTTKVVR